jgi:LysR family transcriptional activator of nhaA
VRAFNHLLGETGISFFGTKALHARYGRDFPRRLDGAPMLLPLENVALRRSLNLWFDRQGILPRIVAEFEDSALMKVFGGDGVGVFPSPTVVEREIAEQYGVRVLGRADDVRERFYAITVERRLKHPAVLAISDAARHDLFVPPALR